jgi:hypothetical protein
LCRTAAAIPRFVGRLLFWIFAVGMAFEVPLGSSWPDGARTARALEFRAPLTTAVADLVDPEREDGPEGEDGRQTPAQVDGPPVPFDAAAATVFDARPPETARAARPLHRDPAVSSRTAVAWASARAPPFLSLG